MTRSLGGILLSVVTARMGTLAVVQSIANDIALPRQTLSRYLDLLELVFVIERIPACCATW